MTKGDFYINDDVTIIEVISYNDRTDTFDCYVICSDIIPESNSIYIVNAYNYHKIVDPIEINRIQKLRVFK